MSLSLYLFHQLLKLSGALANLRLIQYRRHFSQAPSLLQGVASAATHAHLFGSWEDEVNETEGYDGLPGLVKGGVQRVIGKNHSPLPRKSMKYEEMGKKKEAGT